jgi:heme exporter protein CcmD
MVEFFAMGGYGWYIWWAYGALAAVLALEITAVRSRRKAVVEEARLTAPETATGMPGGAA